MSGEDRFTEGLRGAFAVVVARGTAGADDGKKSKQDEAVRNHNCRFACAIAISSRTTLVFRAYGDDLATQFAQPSTQANIIRVDGHLTCFEFRQMRFFLLHFGLQKLELGLQRCIRVVLIVLPLIKIFDLLPIYVGVGVTARYCGMRYQNTGWKMAQTEGTGSTHSD